MTKITDGRFPPQRAMKKNKGHAAGSYFEGVCVVSMEQGGIAIIGANVEALRVVWNKIHNFELDVDGVQHVTIFSADDTTPNPKEAA